MNNEYQRELKPCPFCGGEAVTHGCIELENEQLRGIYGGKVGVHCSVCKVATLPFDDETQAVVAWNRRVGGTNHDL